MSNENVDVEEVSSECKYCSEDDPVNLTTCDNCNIVFCIYCIGTGHHHTIHYDVCPNCKTSFEW